NLLKWETASETNNDYFTVERSIDGASFNSIGTVPGAGHSNTRLSYEFADKNLLHQGEQLLYYYRLKQTDYDGQFAYSEIIALKRQKPDGLIVSELYPNPAYEYVHFSYTNKENQPLKVEVYGPMGKEISKIYDGLDLSPQIDIRDLKDGIYIVKIAQQSWQTTRKLLVIKGTMAEENF
ncbi:MAG: T9SS type A sorting domain-containing protein, partial [Flavobacteriales bacterium]|nr:T9SS type A sorting domain-containing protein [Flavobacteriales bacterium]